MFRKLKFFSFVTAFVMMFVAGASYPASTEISGARDVVVDTIHVIYEEIAANAISDESLKPVATDAVHRELLPKLHVDKFSKLILAAHWKKATESQRSEFTRILTEFLLRSFVNAILSNRDKLNVYQDSITILDAKPAKKEGRATVAMLVKYPGTQEVRIDFRMTSEDGAWKVYDVAFEGVSFAINYRMILNSAIKKSGIEAVTANLGDKLN